MKKLRMTIDIAMTIVLIGLMAYSLIGTLTHEILGTAMFVLFIVHHILMSLHLGLHWNVMLGAMQKGKDRKKTTDWVLGRLDRGCSGVLGKPDVTEKKVRIYT